MNIARSSTKIFVANIGSAFLGLIGFAFFAQELGPAQLGIFALFQSIVGIITFFTDFGIRTSVKKRISEGEHAAEFLTTGVVMKIPLLLVVACLVYAFHGRINQYIGAEVAMLIIAAIVIGDFGGLMIDVLRGELRVGATAIINFSRQLIWVGIGTVLVVAGLRAHALIYAFLIGSTVQLLWSAHRRLTQFGRPSTEHARSVFDFAKSDLVAGLSWQVFNWTDVLVLGWLLGQAAVGAYEVAWRIAGVTAMLSNAIRVTVLPQVSAWDADDDTARIERLVGNLLTPSLFFVVPSLFGVAVLSRQVLEVVFGQEFTVAWLVLIVLTGRIVLKAIQNVLSQSLLGLDQPNLLARSAAVSSTLNIILNIVLVLQFGLIGAAVATALSTAVGTLLIVRYLSRSITVKFPFREIGWCTGAAAIMAVAVYWFREMVEINTILELSFAIGIGAVVYGAGVLASGQLRERIVVNIRSILG
jgi:O-antigen/teichoic acid export membrane protein